MLERKEIVMVDSIVTSGVKTAMPPHIIVSEEAFKNETIKAPKGFNTEPVIITEEQKELYRKAVNYVKNMISENLDKEHITIDGQKYYVQHKEVPNFEFDPILRDPGPNKPIKPTKTMEYIEVDGKEYEVKEFTFRPGVIMDVTDNKIPEARKIKYVEIDGKKYQVRGQQPPKLKNPLIIYKA